MQNVADLSVLIPSIEEHKIIMGNNIEIVRLYLVVENTNSYLLDKLSVLWLPGKKGL